MMCAGVETAVIWESSYWKEPLLVMARRIDAAKRAKRLSGRQMTQAEKDVFLGCFSVRKLMHSAQKLTDACRDMRVPLTWSPNVRRVDALNWHKIDELYDLTVRQAEARDLEFFCGRIIHSFVFVPEQGEHGGLTGFYFGSDRDRNARLYRVTVEEIIRVFEAVGNDNPVNISGKRDPASGDWTFKVE